MVTRRTVRSLSVALTTTRALLVLALPIITWLVIVPSKTTSVSPQPDEILATPTPADIRHELAWYAPLWTRDLKQPPIPPVQAPVPANTAPPPEAPRLVATFVDERARYAHLVDNQGRMFMKGIDESIGGFKVAAIEPGKVELVNGSRSVWVEVPKPK